MGKIVVGKIVNTFGIKGELKVVSDFEMAARAFQKGNKILINKKEHIISNSRYHHYNYLIEIDNIKDINAVTYLIGSKIEIDITELKLKENEYLMCELPGYDVIFNERVIGQIEDVIINKVNPLIKVNEHFIPLNDHFIKRVVVKEKSVECQNIDELMKEG